jgi:hypothetical protein
MLSSDSDGDASYGETFFETSFDILVLGVAFLITAFVAFRRMSISQQAPQGGAETTVVTAFYSLIFVLGHSLRSHCTLFLLLTFSVNVLQARKVDQISPGSATGNDVNDWIQARCSEDGVALWVYEGVLVDPLEGRKIANVEGLEIVRHLSTVGDSKNHSNKRIFRRECGDLEVGSLISHPNATFDRASTILSRKLFCYKAPENPRQLLNSIKLRPNSPTRKIPTKQAVAVYETATTFISRGKELIAHTEWPDRQSIWGRATRNVLGTTSQDGDSNSEKGDQKTFDFTIYARQKSANKKKEQLFDLTKPPIDPGSNSPALVSSPKRGKLIEFGASSSTGKDKFGARETYSYIMRTEPSADPEGGILQRLGIQKSAKPTDSTVPSCTVRYTRYGEGPPFFGPGRICSLELQGRRVYSFDDLPPLTSSLIANRISSRFLSDYRESDQSIPGKNKALDIFRSPGPALQVQPTEDEPSDFWLPDYLKQHGQIYWSRLQQRASKFSLKQRKQRQPPQEQEQLNWADKVHVPP